MTLTKIEKTPARLAVYDHRCFPFAAITYIICLILVTFSGFFAIIPIVVSENDSNCWRFYCRVGRNLDEHLETI